MLCGVEVEQRLANRGIHELRGEVMPLTHSCLIIRNCENREVVLIDKYIAYYDKHEKGFPCHILQLSPHILQLPPPITQGLVLRIQDWCLPTLP